MPLQNFKTLNGIYRGIVVYNEDPRYSGRVKIYVPGIYPIEFKNQHELLPWAEPAMSIEGGSWANEKATRYAENSFSVVKDKDESDTVRNSTNIEDQAPKRVYIRNAQHKEPIGLNTETGYCSVPHAGKYFTDGAQVFLFFEAGDPNKPVYFAAAQSGTGWFSEHPNQHVFHSDNIRVRIDEEPDRNESTCKFHTYNAWCVKQTLNSAGAFKFLSPSEIDYDVNTSKLKKTHLDIEVFNTNKEDIAVNLKVTGHVNVNIEGDIYLHHIGNRYETHQGNTYLHHIGDTYIQREGNIVNIQEGNILSYREGNVEKTMYGNRIESEEGNLSKVRLGDENITIDGKEIHYVEEETTHHYNNTYTRTTYGKTMMQYIDDVKIDMKKNFTHLVAGTWNVTSTVVNWIVNVLFTFIDKKN